MHPLLDRMLRASKLEVRLFEEVEADENATRDAGIVVAISALAAAIGSPFVSGLGGFLFAIVVALIAWYAWAYITYFIGTRLLPEPETKANHGELLRTLGFAAAPGTVRVFGIVPGIGPLAVFAGSVWMLVSSVIAIRQALDYTSTLRAVGVTVLGWIVYMVVVAVPVALLGSCGNSA